MDESHVSRQPTLRNTGALDVIQTLGSKDGAIRMTLSHCRSFDDGNGQIHRRETDIVHHYLTTI